MPLFFEDRIFNGGWDLLVEDDVDFLECISHTSGSTLQAERSRNSQGWNLTLTVPADNEAPNYPGPSTGPYKGAYWKAFHTALGFEKGE